RSICLPVNPVRLVVNPSASSDVRRLTSLAQNIDVHTRVNGNPAHPGATAGGAVNLANRTRRAAAGPDPAATSRAHEPGGTGDLGPRRRDGAATPGRSE